MITAICSFIYAVNCIFLFQGDAPFQCHQCDAKFKINSDLKRHIRTHSGEKPYKCDFCEYRCAMKGNLKSHIQLKHSTENSFQCTHCDFKCSTKNALREHSREHQPVQPILCSKCTYSCSSKWALKVHERIHSEERPFKCDFCSFATKQRSSLVIHKKKCHSDKPEKAVSGKSGRGAGKGGGSDSPKPVSSRYRAKLDAARAFSCDSCSASFVREDSLRSHKKQHRDAENMLQLHTVDLVSQTNTQLQVPPVGDHSAAPYSSAQLKIIVSHPLVQDSTVIPAGLSGQEKTNLVLLRPDNQQVVVNSMIQQVNLLTPTLGSAEASDSALKPQTVLLTQLSSQDTDHPLHQAMLQTSIAAQDSSHGAQAFITTCSELESLNALIQEGGTEVTIVTVGHTSTETPPSGFFPPLEDKMDTSKESVAACEESTMVPIIGDIIHSVPLMEPQQSAIEPLSPQTHFSDSHTLEGIP